MNQLSSRQQGCLKLVALAVVVLMVVGVLGHSFRNWDTVTLAIAAVIMSVAAATLTGMVASQSPALGRAVAVPLWSIAGALIITTLARFVSEFAVQTWRELWIFHPLFMQLACAAAAIAVGTLLLNVVINVLRQSNGVPPSLRGIVPVTAILGVEVLALYLVAMQYQTWSALGLILSLAVGLLATILVPTSFAAHGVSRTLSNCLACALGIGFGATGYVAMFQLAGAITRDIHPAIHLLLAALPIFVSVELIRWVCTMVGGQFAHAAPQMAPSYSRAMTTALPMQLVPAVRMPTPVPAAAPQLVNDPFCGTCGLRLAYAGQKCTTCYPSTQASAFNQPVLAQRPATNPLPVQHQAAVSQGLTRKHSKVTFGPWQLYVLGELGDGSQSTVQKVFTADGRVFALKQMVFNPSKAARGDAQLKAQELKEAVDNFRYEAAVLTALRHARIPRCHHVGQLVGHWFMLIDYVDGQSLEAKFKASQSSMQPLAVRDVVTWANQLLDVFAYIHSPNPPLIFRDLKPANVMVDADGVCLIDFGVATPQNLEEHAIPAYGTAGYCPPEQFGGIATPQCDLYALGSLMHQLLTGLVPMEKPHYDREPISKYRPEVPGHIAAVVNKALQLDPAHRFASAAEMKQALRVVHSA